MVRAVRRTTSRISFNTVWLGSYINDMIAGVLAPKGTNENPEPHLICRRACQGFGSESKNDNWEECQIINWFQIKVYDWEECQIDFKSVDCNKY